MQKELDTGTDPYTTVGWLTMPYSYSSGYLASRFFTELRDNTKILGVKCHKCNTVIVPPRSVCAKCYSKLEELVELPNKGTLQTFTVVHYSSSAHPIETPFAYGSIQLDGANTGLTHILGEVDLNKIEIGMRVKAVFGEKRKGDILDIKYFKPLSTG